jgi:hypothetical protein
MGKVMIMKQAANKTVSMNTIKITKTMFQAMLLIIMMPLLAGPLSAQVEILGTWETGTSHTEESGTDRALIFIAHGEMGGTMNLNSVTYGGQAMTKIVDRDFYDSGSNYNAYVAAFILDEADIATATGDTFNPSWDVNPTEIKYSSVFLSGVEQTGMLGMTATAGSTSNPLSTSALTTSIGDMVFAVATCGNTGTYTFNNGFTSGSQESSASSTGAAGYKFATGSSETPDVSHTNVNRQALIGFVVLDSPPDPNKATNPDPNNGESNVSVSTNLSWDAPAGFTPTSYDVYFGTNPTAHSNPKYEVSTNSYDPPGNLAEGTPYYWAVDPNDDGTVHTGDPWNFTTG